MITEEQWQSYSRNGYLRLGKILEPAALDALRSRADDLAQGRITNPALQMQLDTGGTYESLPGTVRNFDRATLLYRKI